MALNLVKKVRKKFSYGLLVNEEGRKTQIEVHPESSKILGRPGRAAGHISEDD